MLYCLDRNLVLLSEEESNKMKNESDMPEYVLDAFNVADLLYIDGVYSFWLEMYLENNLFDNRLCLDLLADPILKCSNADYGLKDDTEFNSFGVCDSIENLLSVYPFLKENNENYIVTLSLISKKFESEPNFRWHKAGTYIGNQNPRYEYFYNENDEIQEVYTFKIYRVLGKGETDV